MWGSVKISKNLKIGHEKSLIILSSMDRILRKSLKSFSKKFEVGENYSFLRAQNTQNFGKSKSDENSKSFALGNSLVEAKQNHISCALHYFM